MKPTAAEWTKYYHELHAYSTRKQATKPRRYEYGTIEEFRIAMRQWEFEYHCDKPNPPGYEFANNH